MGFNHTSLPETPEPANANSMSWVGFRAPCAQSYHLELHDCHRLITRLRTQTHAASEPGTHNPTLALTNQGSRLSVDRLVGIYLSSPCSCCFTALLDVWAELVELLPVFWGGDIAGSCGVAISLADSLGVSLSWVLVFCINQDTLDGGAWRTCVDRCIICCWNLCAD